jgi:hypothetical protein
MNLLAENVNILAREQFRNISSCKDLISGAGRCDIRLLHRAVRHLLYFDAVLQSSAICDSDYSLAFVNASLTGAT